ncbi:MAG: anthranilate phosphoribosyltransferase [Anaeroplasmataceae bacterium]
MDNKKVLEKVCNREDLTYEECYEAIDLVMKGQLEQSYVAALLTALKMKGESITEIKACAMAMRDNALTLDNASDAIDIVGTGGDNAHTFNISTISSFIIAASGVKVAKHGNRSVSSLCGAADCFEALGVNIKTTKEEATKILDKTNMVFLFAQIYHSSMKNVGPIRKALGVRTIFNILGPLTNPGKVNNIVLGVYDEKLLEVMAKVCKEMGLKKAVIVHGDDGLDEVTLTTTTKMVILKDGEITKFTFDPHSYGFDLCTRKDLEGGTVEENKEIALGILNGTIKGPKRNCVIINSAIAIYLMKDNYTLDDAIKEATLMIDSKKALEKLNEYVKASNI